MAMNLKSKQQLMLRTSSNLKLFAAKSRWILSSNTISGNSNVELMEQEQPTTDFFMEQELPTIDFHRRRSREIHWLCKSGNIADALRLLENMRSFGYRPDGLNLSSIVHGLCNSGRFAEAHNFVLSALDSKWVPDERLCNIIIAKLCSAKMPSETLRVMNRMISLKDGYVPIISNYNKIIHGFCRQGRFMDAHHILDEMKIRGWEPNVVSYTSLLSGYCAASRVDDAWQLFEKMRSGCRDSGCFPNSLTYSVMVVGLYNGRRIADGRNLMAELWAEMPVNDQACSQAAYGNLVRGLCKGGFFDDALSLVNSVPYGDCNVVDTCFAYAALIDAFCDVGFVDGAVRAIFMIRKRGIFPDGVSCSSVLHGLCKQESFQEANKVLHDCLDNGYIPPEPTFQILVKSFCRAGEWAMAKELLDFMLGKSRLDKSRIYNIFMYALCDVDDPGRLLNTMMEMLQDGYTPDLFTLNTVIHGLCKAGQVDEAKMVLNDMLEGKFCGPDVVSFSSIIHGLSKLGRTDEALHILQQMIEAGYCPNVLTYNSVLHGLGKFGKVEQAFQVIKEMSNHGVSPDKVSYTFVIDALAKNGESEKAIEFWHNVVKPSNKHDDFLYAALMKSVCAAGKLMEAWDLLDELIRDEIKPDVVVYNIVIDAACRLGSTNDALKIVEKMKLNNLSPDIVTWRILGRRHRNYDNKDASVQKSSKNRKETLSEFFHRTFDLDLQ